MTISQDTYVAFVHPDLEADIRGLSVVHRRELRYVLRRVRRTGRCFSYVDNDPPLIWTNPQAAAAMLHTFKRSGDMDAAITMYEITRELTQ